MVLGGLDALEIKGQCLLQVAALAGKIPEETERVATTPGKTADGYPSKRLL